MPEQLFHISHDIVKKFAIDRASLGRVRPYLAHIVIKLERQTTYLFAIGSVKAFLEYVRSRRDTVIRTATGREFAKTIEAKEAAEATREKLATFLASRELFLASELARVTGVSIVTVNAWVRAGFFEGSQHVGGRRTTIIPRQALEHLLVLAK